MAFMITSTVISAIDNNRLIVDEVVLLSYQETGLLHLCNGMSEAIEPSESKDH